MKHKLRGIGVQLVISFVIAIMIPTLILAFEAINTTKTTQESNINITRHLQKHRKVSEITLRI